MTQEGQYRWVDGTPLPYNSSLWALDQPNNHSPQEDCMAIPISDRYPMGIHDIGCFSKYNFLCERDL
ncbi:hypothetical protein ACOMHN_042554 [Nucella lapillus]